MTLKIKVMEGIKSDPGIGMFLSRLECRFQTGFMERKKGKKRRIVRFQEMKGRYELLTVHGLRMRRPFRVQDGRTREGNDERYKRIRRLKVEETKRTKSCQYIGGVRRFEDKSLEEKDMEEMSTPRIIKLARMAKNKRTLTITGPAMASGGVGG